VHITSFNEVQFDYGRFHDEPKEDEDARRFVARQSANAAQGVAGRNRQSRQSHQTGVGRRADHLNLGLTALGDARDRIGRCGKTHHRSRHVG